jgi:hypothetical protein
VDKLERGDYVVLQVESTWPDLKQGEVYRVEAVSRTGELVVFYGCEGIIKSSGCKKVNDVFKLKGGVVR